MSDSDIQVPPTAWNMIKPEAATFTDMILHYGIEGIVAQDIFDTEDYGSLSEDDTFGFVFAYKEGSLQFQDTSIEDSDATNIVFTKQFIDNSCATLSLFNILFNMDGNKDHFTQGFLSHTAGMDSINRGKAFMISPPFKKIHNSYDIMENQAKNRIKGTMNTPEFKNETSYHYISYIYKNNAIWELDNQKQNPIKLRSISNDGHKENWLLVLKEILRNKLETNSLESNLIAITLDPIVLKEHELRRTYSEIRRLETKLMSIAKPLFTRKTSGKSRMAGLSKKSRKTLCLKQKLVKQTQNLRKELKQLKQIGSIEQDNIDRRKFDYSSFIWGILEILFEKAPNMEEIIASSNAATEQVSSTLLQDSENATYLSLKEKDPAEASSSKKGKPKKGNDSTFVRRVQPKRKCTENVVYSVKKVSVVPSALFEEGDQLSGSRVITQKRNHGDTSDEDSSNRGKRRYFLRK